MNERAALGSEAGLKGRSRKGISRAEAATQVSSALLIQQMLAQGSFLLRTFGL